MDGARALRPPTGVAHVRARHRVRGHCRRAHAPRRRRHARALPSFDTAPGRDDWHQVGPPIEVRSLTSTCDGKVVLANVHVGGILRSTDGGESWEPTMDVDNDVHEVLAHPDRPDVVVAAAAIGLLRSHDAGATWAVETTGLSSTYSRAVAALDDTLYLSNADGPFAKRLPPLLRAPSTAERSTPVDDGLPDGGARDDRHPHARRPQRHDCRRLAGRPRLGANPRQRHLDATRRRPPRTSPASPSSEPTGPDRCRSAGLTGTAPSSHARSDDHRALPVPRT